MRTQYIAGPLCATALFVPAAHGAAASAADAEPSHTISALDAKVFDAYNSGDLRQIC
ncbi:hypothetical protein ACFOLJ_24335 [Rugamonas sp. CCM 8940]|uniref:hypothetical protein n=1 Tax=Rugamonas sp. CCM 8940 TaxID=2765359 RepID=UPI0018F4BA84|nr:hypothetical protein [Rugamonas sp. CCM 8940]MBJ7310495.1 hypothetical protein [Rugamonas sp. CCM 8940]